MPEFSDENAKKVLDFLASEPIYSAMDPIDRQGADKLMDLHNDNKLEYNTGRKLFLRRMAAKYGYKGTVIEMIDQSHKNLIQYFYKRADLLTRDEREMIEDMYALVDNEAEFQRRFGTQGYILHLDHLNEKYHFTEETLQKGKYQYVIKKQDDEWVAKCYVDGKYDEGKTYYSGGSDKSSKDDAIATAKAELERVSESRLNRLLSGESVREILK